MSDNMKWTCRRCGGKGRLMHKGVTATDISIARYVGALDSLYEPCDACKGQRLVSTIVAAEQEVLLPAAKMAFPPTGEPGQSLRRQSQERLWNARLIWLGACLATAAILWLLS